MAASVGSVNVDYLWGRVPELAMTAEETTRPGADGHAHAKVAQRAPEGSLRTMTRYSSAANALAGYRAAQDVVHDAEVTVTYGDGTTVANVAVLEVQMERAPQHVRNASGAVSSEYLLWLVWRVQHRGAGE